MARFQACIFCDSRVRNSICHVVAVCPRWRDLRQALEKEIGIVAASRRQDFTLQVLRLGVDHGALEAACRLAAEIDNEELQFWRRV